MPKITIFENVCQGCGLCVIACPKQVIAMSENKINAKGYHPAEAVKQADCIGCAMCYMMCPHIAIEIEKE